MRDTTEQENKKKKQTCLGRLMVRGMQTSPF